MISFKDINGGRFIQSKILWDSCRGVESHDRFRSLMRSGGVTFFDQEGFFIQKPSVGITGIGGIPIVWEETTPDDEIGFILPKSTFFNLEQLTEAMTEMMGYGGFFSYLNPKDTSSADLVSKMNKKGHLSTGHTVYINFVVLGISTSVENEFNSQRDLIHLARFTEARTKSQNLPSVVVLYPEYLELYKKIFHLTKNEVENYTTPDNQLTISENLEVRNLIFPSAKATGFMMSATIRNLQKLVSALTDEGKEEEYKRVLSLINDSLHLVLPEIFKPTKDYGYQYLP